MAELSVEMKPMHSLYRNLWLLIGALCIIIIIVSWLGFSDACPLASDLERGRAEYPRWCFEFWLYRYQTLIGAGAAIAAAVTAWKATTAQSDLTRYTRIHQTFTDLQRMAMGSAAPYVRFLLSCSVDILEQKCLDEHQTRAERQAYLQRRSANVDPFRAAWSEFNDIALQTPMSEALERALAAFRGSMMNMIQLSIVITRAASQIIDQHEDDEDAARLVREALNAHRQGCSTVRDAAETTWEAFRVELNGELERTRISERRYRRAVEGH